MSTGNVTTYGYYIEARAKTGIRKIGGFTVAQEWKRLALADAPDGMGIPRGMWCREAEAVTELVSYPAAQAFIALGAALAEPFSEIEFRLVEAKFTCSWSVEEKRPGNPVDFSERERHEFSSEGRKL